MLVGDHEWNILVPTGYHQNEVQKMGDLKFFECPQSFITRRSWQIIALVNETADADGNILHLPFSGTILEQPLWYRGAVKMVRSERHSDWNRELQEKRARAKTGRT